MQYGDCVGLELLPFIFNLNVLFAISKNMEGSKTLLQRNP